METSQRFGMWGVSALVAAFRNPGFLAGCRRPRQAHVLAFCALMLLGMNALGSELENGPVVQGSIATPGAQESWTFTVAAGDVVRLRMVKISGSLWPEMLIYNPSSQLVSLTSSSVCTTPTLTITNSGTYTIICEDGFSGTYTGTYNLSMIRIGYPLSANDTDVGPIKNGAVRTGTISPAGDLDAATFVASAGDVVRLRMTKTSGSLWPEMLIYNPSGKLVSSTSSSVCATPTLTITNSGTYTIICEDGFNGDYTGTYNLSMIRVGYPLSASDADIGPLTNGAVRAGRISPTGDLDAATFVASAGDVVRLRMTKTSGALWPEMLIYNPSGKLISSTSSSVCATPTLTITNSGTYTIICEDGFNGDYTGTYNLSMIRIGYPLSASDADIGPIVTGVTYTGRINPTGDLDAATFLAWAGDVVSLRMTKTSGSLWPEMLIYNPSGKLISSTSSSVCATPTLTITNSGTYTIISEDGFNGDYTGTYNLSMTIIPGSPFKAALAVAANPAYGGVVSGSGTYNVGQPAQISATANPGYEFSGWSDSGAQTHIVTVPSGGAAYTATFKQKIVDAKLYWQSPTGQVLGWLMNTNGTAKSVFNVLTNATAWRVRAAGDINRDGVSDLLWQLPTGQVLCWLMNANNTAKSVYYVHTYATTALVRTAGDINNDDVADLIWQLSTGQVFCWQMPPPMTTNGISAFYIHNAATTWQVRAAGDINKDGVADLVWQLPTGQVLCWFMNANGTAKSSCYIKNTATTWQVRAAGDINKDGVADLIWQLPTGQVVCWLMNTNGTAKSSFYIYNAATTWQIRCAGW